MPTTTSVSRFMPAPIPGEFSISDRKRSPAAPFIFPPKPRLFSVLVASVHDHNSNSRINLKNHLFSCSYLFSEDSPLIARSSLQSSNSVSDSNLRVAYQGVPGAYSEEAAEKAYPNCQPVPCAQFDSAFQAVENGSVDRAVLPIENSIGGSIHRNYDLLFRHGLSIVGEVNLPIRHCLLANPDVKIEDLKKVLSHPQALAQCENTLTKLGLSKEEVYDTAFSAKYVADQKLIDTGAIANSRAASLYGLNILAQDIQDKHKNITRFVMLAKEPIFAGLEKPFKTSIVFSLKEGPGVLFKALAVFAFREITLSKIESRPLNVVYIPQSGDGKYSSPIPDSDDGNDKFECFDYLFHVDFQASMADTRAQFALKSLEEFSTFLRVLGSYPMDTTKG